MSLYDFKKEISLVTKTRYIKKYKDDDVVARFVKNNKTIELHYKNYNKKLLMHHMELDYEKKFVYIDFWDPKFCSDKNITEEDRLHISKLLNYDGDERITIAGYISSLISLHKIILNSYMYTNYDIEKYAGDFDKNILKLLFCKVDFVISFNNNLIGFINNIFDKESIVDFVITPSGKFRFETEDIKYFLEGTKRVHEISTLIVNSTRNIKKILNFHLELLNVCDIIYSPDLITSYRAENVLLNILKLNADMDIYEKLIFKLIDKYADKDGSIDIIFDIKGDKYQNIFPLLDAIKEYRLSLNSSNF